jgi:hypothetical protein
MPQECANLGLPVEQIIGRRNYEVAPEIHVETAEAAMSRVRDEGEPAIDFRVTGRLPSDPEREGVWSANSFRLTDSDGHMLGMCQTFVDVTEGHRAQRRLELLNEASVRIGATLDVVRTAQELADMAVPQLADVATVDLLDVVVRGEEPAPTGKRGVRDTDRHRTGTQVLHQNRSPAGQTLTGPADELGSVFKRSCPK